MKLEGHKPRKALSFIWSQRLLHKQAKASRAGWVSRTQRQVQVGRSGVGIEDFVRGVWEASAFVLSSADITAAISQRLLTSNADSTLLLAT